MLKKLNLIRAIFLFCCLGASLWGKDIEKPPLIVTVPKSGTHFIKLIVQNLINKTPIVPNLPETGPTFIPYLDTQFSPSKSFLILHVESVLDIDAYLERYPTSKKILMVRNLRDVLVSAKDYISRYGFDVLPFFKDDLSDLQMTHSDWILLSEKEKLLKTMEYFFHFQKREYRRFGLCHFVEDALQFVELHPDALVVRFEDFFSDERGMLDQVRRIARFLGKECSQKQLERILWRSFGSIQSRTFTNKKKLYRFKDEFDDELLAKFLEYFGEEEERYNRFFNYSF